MSLPGVERVGASDRWTCGGCLRSAMAGRGMVPPGWIRRVVRIDGREGPGEPLCQTCRDERRAK